MPKTRKRKISRREQVRKTIPRPKPLPKTRLNKPRKEQFMSFE